MFEPETTQPNSTHLRSLSIRGFKSNHKHKSCRFQLKPSAKLQIANFSSNRKPNSANFRVLSWLVITYRVFNVQYKSKH